MAESKIIPLCMCVSFVLYHCRHPVEMSNNPIASMKSQFITKTVYAK